MEFTSQELTLYAMLVIVVALAVLSMRVRIKRDNYSPQTLRFIEGENGMQMEFFDHTGLSEDSERRFRSAFYVGKVVRYEGKSYRVLDVQEVMTEGDKTPSKLICPLEET